MNIADAGAVCDAFAVEGRLPHLAVIVIDHQTSLGLKNILATHPTVLSVQILGAVSFSDPAPTYEEPGVACHQCSNTEPATRNGKLIPSLVVEEADDYKIAGSLLDGSIKPHAPPPFLRLFELQHVGICVFAHTAEHVLSSSAPFIRLGAATGGC